MKWFEAFRTHWPPYTMLRPFNSVVGQHLLHAAPAPAPAQQLEIQTPGPLPAQRPAHNLLTKSITTVSQGKATRSLNLWVGRMLLVHAQELSRGTENIS
jgi:hypothetical protein